MAKRAGGAEFNGAGPAGAATSSAVAATSKMAKMLTARGIDVSQFAAARAKEMKAMEADLEQRSGAGKRTEMVDTDNASKSRRHKRRPRHMRAAFEARSSRVRWLETHLWHAKRFQMAEQWGFHVPQKPSDKSERVNYRFVRDHVSIQDASFMQTLVLDAPDHRAGAAVLDAAASTTLYHATGQEWTALLRYPDGSVVAPISYFWSERSRTAGWRCWITVHPASLAVVEALLRGAAGNSVAAHDLELTHVNTEYTNRFRLRGPAALQLLQCALQPAIEAGDRLPSGILSESTRAWNELNRSDAEKVILANTVLQLAVWDPRLQTPSQMMKRKEEWLAARSPKPTSTDPAQASEATCMTATSAAWFIEEDSRRASSEGQAHVAKLNQRRAAAPVSGATLQPGDHDSIVPILLIQKPGARTTQGGRLGFGAGWDLIVPRRWALPFWMMLVHAGARVHGQAEERRLALESGQLAFPYHCVGSSAYEAWRQSELDARQRRWQARPPAKRLNYCKLNVAAPFIADWSLLGGNPLPQVVYNEQVDGHLRDRPLPALHWTRLRVVGRGKLDDRCAVFALPNTDRGAALLKLPKHTLPDLDHPNALAWPTRLLLRHPDTNRLTWVEARAMSEVAWF
ncbi:uncharacterized protein MONBRDRAFT_5868 [Monosiga brevicollis MX1]|uniref:Uncharacterized protein n=1 Tax=Monosiga brevicollis TaxID=81824 RepID=A9USQ4_MONBE|nr:uncharacterized protein MONBRDRAFT_5868 [Monosiga brevicollis MX1]EDQ91820.1 predicted protein [Monosiga brevicollis MX1]|eukprot:XP_001743106.1 hypothetical protein [Monosiga brevicollis MX1]